jgi:hypothetical protein
MDHRSVDESLIPRLDPKEVAAVFSAPFHNFLREADEAETDQTRWRGRPMPDGSWYEGAWSQWHGRPWRMHVFHVPVDNQRVTRPRARDGGLAAIGEDEDTVGGEGEGDDQQEEEEITRYKVWGMTARIIVEAAMVAYGESPEFEHNKHFGDEDLIGDLFKAGKLPEKKRSAL